MCIKLIITLVCTMKTFEELASCFSGQGQVFSFPQPSYCSAHTRPLFQKPFQCIIAALQQSFYLNLQNKIFFIPLTVVVNCWSLMIILLGWYWLMLDYLHWVEMHSTYHTKFTLCSNVSTLVNLFACLLFQNFNRILTTAQNSNCIKTIINHIVRNNGSYVLSKVMYTFTFAYNSHSCDDARLN